MASTALSWPALRCLHSNMLIATRIPPSSLPLSFLPLSLYPHQPIAHDRRCDPIRRGDGIRSRANRDIPFSSIVTRTMSPLYSISTRRNFAWLRTGGATKHGRTAFPSPPLNFQGGSIDRIESNRSIDRSDPIRSERYRRCVIGTRLVNRARYRDRDRRAWLRFVLSRADRSHCKHRSYRAIVAARVSHLYPSTDHFPVTCFVGYHSHRRGGEKEGEKNRRSSILTSRSRSISITQRSDYYFRALSKPRLSKYTRYFSTFTKKKKKETLVETIFTIFTRSPHKRAYNSVETPPLASSKRSLFNPFRSTPSTIYYVYM